MLGNVSGTDFQASPHHHRPVLAIDAATATDARCAYSFNKSIITNDTNSILVSLLN